MDFERFIRRIGRNARKARWKAKMTQEDTAAAAGITVRVVAELERGHGNPTTQTLFLLADALHTSVSELTATGREEPLPPSIRAPKRGRKPKLRRRGRTPE